MDGAGWHVDEASSSDLNRLVFHEEGQFALGDIPELVKPIAVDVGRSARNTGFGDVVDDGEVGAFGFDQGEHSHLVDSDGERSAGTRINDHGVPSPLA
jgi:hypothetical protein